MGWRQLSRPPARPVGYFAQQVRRLRHDLLDDNFIGRRSPATSAGGSATAPSHAWEDRPARVSVVSTASPALDIALGVGGVPRGRVTEIYGPESSGKTTLCQHLIAEAQRRGEATAFIDVEHALERPTPPLRGGREELVSLPAGYRRATRWRSPRRWCARGGRGRRRLGRPP